MPTRQALEEIISSSFSSPLQVSDAEFLLHKLDNPSVTPVDLVPPADPGTLPAYEWLAGLADPTISDEGSPAREKWLDGAKKWLEAIIDDPQYSAELKDQAQRRHACHTKPEAQWIDEWDAETAAWLADREARYAVIRSANPSWSDLMVHNLDMDQQNGKPVPVAVVPPVTTPSQNEQTTNAQIQQLLSDDHRLDIEPRSRARRCRNYLRWNKF